MPQLGVVLMTGARAALIIRPLASGGGVPRGFLESTSLSAEEIDCVRGTASSGIRNSRISFAFLRDFAGLFLGEEES